MRNFCKSYIKPVILTLFFLIFSYLIFLLYKKGIFHDREKLFDLFFQSYFISIPLFILLRVIISFIPFIPNSLMMIVGFAVFPIEYAFFVNYFAILISSVFNYKLVAGFNSRLKKRYKKSITKRYEKFLNRSQKHFNIIFFLIQAIPFMPDNVFCLLAAMTNLDFKKFLKLLLISKVINISIFMLIMKYFFVVFNYIFLTK